MTVVLVVLAVVYNLFVLVPAVLFAVITYVFWRHGSGRMDARFTRRVERQSAGGSRTQRRRADSSGQGGQAGATDGRGGFGAGPRQEWRGPRAEQRARQRQRRRTPPTATESPSPAEAYATLGLDPGADQAEIKAAYRTKVKEVHPDTKGGDEDQFKRVNRAYERLRED
jgi:hypothetical protein